MAVRQWVRTVDHEIQETSICSWFRSRWGKRLWALVVFAWITVIAGYIVCLIWALVGP